MNKTTSLIIWHHPKKVRTENHDRLPKQAINVPGQSNPKKSRFFPHCTVEATEEIFVHVAS